MERNMDEIEDQLQEYMVGSDKVQIPTIVVVLLSRETNYPAFKLLFDKY
jgi:hypothetical protein